MKLKDVWKYFDDTFDYIVWYADKPGAENTFKKVEGVMYEGCPKKLKNYHLIKTKNNEDDGAIFPYKYTSKYGADLVGIRFTVVKKQ